MTKIRSIYRARVRTAILILLIATLTLVGCSRVRIAYNTADFFIERYADDYLALDSGQLADWRPSLERALANHRSEELPYLALFFDTAATGAARGYDETTVHCMLDQFEAIYRRHFEIASALAAELLVDLDKRQIDALERKFAEKKDDLPDNDEASIARRDRKRAERYAESAEWWIGSVNDAQMQILREVAAAMPDTAPVLERYRAKKQQELIRLLRNGADQARIQRFLSDWLVDYKDIPRELESAAEALRDGFVTLFLRVDATLTDEQRAHLNKRLAALRDDFVRLQPRPRRVQAVCTDAL